MARLGMPVAGMESRRAGAGRRLRPGRQDPGMPASEKAGGPVPTEALALPWGARMSMSLPPENSRKNKPA